MEGWNATGPQGGIGSILPHLAIVVRPGETGNGPPLKVRSETAEVFEALVAEMQKLSSPWLSAGGAAAYLGVDRSTICKWKNQGRLKAYYAPGAVHPRYKRSDLDAIMSTKKEPR